MTCIELELRGVWLIEPDVIADERGTFRRSFCASEFARLGMDARVVQGNVSENPHQGTLRGFHFQVPPFQEAKTLSCLSGGVYDVVIDLRPDSATFMQWISVELSAADRRSLHVPAGCANAWLTIAPSTTVHYYMSEMFSPESYRGFRYNDPAFDIRWPSEPRVISARDRAYLDFEPSMLSSGLS